MQINTASSGHELFFGLSALIPPFGHCSLISLWTITLAHVFILGDLKGAQVGVGASD